MAEICCKTCDSIKCDGCNIYILADALEKGKLEKFINDNRTIDIEYMLNCNS